MKNVWATLLLVFYFQGTSSTLKCPQNSNCLCLPGHESEFQCPREDTEFIIHLTENKQIEIDCIKDDLEKFDINLLPNIKIDKLQKFEIRFCPLPENGFQDILDWFMIEEVKFFRYGIFPLENVVLGKQYFKGFTFLESLQVEDTKVDLEEDVFENTPNLTFLELQRNNIRLKRDLFKYTPLLKHLDISENHIESVPEGVFRNLDKVEVLHLWSNNLSQIDDSTFEGLLNLKSLELSANSINKITESAFKHMPLLARMNLSKNQLRTLPGNVFAYNGKLEEVILRGNPFRTLPQSLLSNLIYLNEVDLSSCEIDTIPDNIFENSTQLKVLHLENNKLRSIPDGLFKSLTKLEKLYLSYNKIEALGFDVFQSLSNLKVLHLDNNLIREIDNTVFSKFTRLEEINLSENKIRKIHTHAFYSCESLKIIDLSRNKYRGDNFSLRFKLLQNVNSAENINLSYNEIEDVDDIIVVNNKPKLAKLDLSHNRITSLQVQLLQPLTKELKVNLEYNEIRNVSFDGVELIAKTNVADIYHGGGQSVSVILLGHNPIACDCTNYDLLKYLKDQMEPEVRVMFDIVTQDVECSEGLKFPNLTLGALVCSFERLSVNDSCPEECSCTWRPHDQSIIVDCSAKNFTDFPEIDFNGINQQMIPFNQTEIHLEDNQLVGGPDKNLTCYDNVTRLYLSRNEIGAVSWLPSKLEVLHLDYNKLRTLNYNILTTLKNSTLRDLTLDHNPWLCDCTSVNFTNFLRQHTKIVDTRNISCANSRILLRDLNRNNLCHEWQIVYTVLVVLLILLPIAIFFALFFRYQQEIKVWLYAHNLCLCWVTEEELDKDKVFDAFISYSHKDEDFIVQNLLPVLDNSYKLCLHYRDWIPGEFITTQVTNSVLESRRTLVVLSQNFLESVWGKMEFRTAHTQAMTEGRARVIIVLYGDIDEEKLDDELKTYMKTNTYVKWGDPYFWNKLKYALPHYKRGTSNNQKIANVMRCIDDKFKLVVPVTPSPGSTPPVLTIDTNELKKNPLNFVSSPEIDTPPAEAGNLLVSTNL